MGEVVHEGTGRTGRTARRGGHPFLKDLAAVSDHDGGDGDAFAEAG